MNQDTMDKLRALNLSQAVMQALATKAIQRCSGNKTPNGSLYSKECAMWAGRIPVESFYALDAALRFCEASQREEAIPGILAVEAKWLEQQISALTPARSA